ncbi:L,D-transpeptidase family protein [Hymenobacter terricola]|uniref:L,D-transpeptidase family protein n=1 Tax=Hymenobacter terricola TaxID=2819236 RepID=UPI001B3185D4|nr:L,D-transpeptidase family protein [Hymenobacter terricola]
MLGGCLGLWLAGAGCGAVSRPVLTSAPPEEPVVAAAPALPEPPPVPSVAALIQAELDTSAGGARAADGRLGLQAGAEVRALYRLAGAPAWTAADSLGGNAAAALALLARAPEHGLRPTDYGLPRLLALRDSLAPAAASAPDAAARARRLARFDVYLSDAVLAFMRDLRRGRLRPYTALVREKAGQHPAMALRAALVAGRVPQAMLAGQPANREYRQLQQALARWLARLGSPDSVARHQARYEQVALNLERWRWEPIGRDDEYLLINLPAFELQVVACDSVLRRFRVIVGKPETPTPTLSSRIKYFTLAPTWNVPYSIASQEMLPRLKEDPGFLNDNNLELYDGRNRRRNPWRIDWERVTEQTFVYNIRQSAAFDNALGSIVFRFPNAHSVYLHDTPYRRLFALPNRALSHGCIRLEHPRELAAYLLRREGRRDPLPSPAEAREADPQDVTFTRPMPVYIRYATCSAEKGRLRFLPDIYQRDEVLRQALFGTLP